MHHTYKILLIFFLTPIFISTEQIPNPSHAYTFNNNPNITASPTITPTFTTTISPNFYTTTTSTINAVGVQIRDITLNIVERAQETFTTKNYDKAKQAIQELLWEYRYNITAYTLLGTYASTSIVLLNDYHYLTNADRWLRWKSNYNFEALCAIPRKELEQELLHAIGEHHYNKKNPTDFTHPLINFIETIEQEIKTCKRYLAMAKIIKNLHLIKILPLNDKKISKISMLLRRALFIKHIFLSWLTERNLTTKALSIRSIAPQKPHLCRH